MKDLPCKPTLLIGRSIKKAARAIDAWLRGETYDAPAKSQTIAFGDLNLPLFLDAGRTQASELPPEARWALQR